MFRKSFLVLFLSLHFLVCFASDEVVFFNVGEGHCTLAYKQGHNPLLIDGGSRRKVLVERQLQEFERNLGRNGQHVVESLTNRVIGYWRTAPAYNLNVILTHRDADHTRYIPFILERLRLLQPGFVCNILLGGTEQQYSADFCAALRPYLNPGLPRFIYSFDHQGLHQGERLGFLQSSGCVTHLFCPAGGTEPNTWSIITRLELNQAPRRFSVLIAGDADVAAQNAHLRALEIERNHELRSNIFLYPHHGGQPLSQAWIQSIDPEVVILSAGRFEGASAHPKAEAIESLFWQGDISANMATINPVEQLTAQVGALQLHNYNRRERIWKPVDPHKIIYYGSKNGCERIQRKLATSRYGHFDFVDDTWYTGFGLANANSWRCALATFPLYNLYSSGTLVIQDDTLHIDPYKVNFIDVPSETDLMMQWINDSVIDGRDRGDFMDFHQLSHLTKRAVYELLRQTARSINEAEKVFFLSFIVIPNIESKKGEISAYREANLLSHLNYFLLRVRGMDFSNADDMRFFKEIEDMLFADAAGYKGLDDIVLFNERCFLFDAFFTGPHLQERDHRNDLFYLYYMIYSLCEHQRAQLTRQNLQALTQSFRQINYRKAADKNFPRGGLEDILRQVVNIYSRCNTEEEGYYSLNIADLGSLVHLLHAHQRPEVDVELVSDVLSVLPVCFNVPAHTTADHLIRLLPRIKAIQGDLTYITDLFPKRLRLSPQTSHLDILGALF